MDSIPKLLIKRKSGRKCSFSFDRFCSRNPNRALHVHLPTYLISVFGMVLHCADLSNPAKPMKLSRHWESRVVSEFFEQGKLEKYTTT
jgi:hypothetical protein